VSYRNRARVIGIVIINGITMNMDGMIVLRRITSAIDSGREVRLLGISLSGREPPFRETGTAGFTTDASKTLADLSPHSRRRGTTDQYRKRPNRPGNVGLGVPLMGSRPVHSRTGAAERRAVTARDPGGLV
jgi:hypothetical protein